MVARFIDTIVEEIETICKGVDEEPRPPLKARLSLLEQEFLMEMAKVMDFGTRKYALHDWKTNANVTTALRIDSLLRHAGKFSSHTFADLDDDTALSHLAHVAVNAMMLWWIVKYKPERDDRYKDESNTGGVR